MDLLKNNRVYWEFLGQCTQCKHCVESCESLTNNHMSLGDIAKKLLNAERISNNPEDLFQTISDDGELVSAIRGCFFCTSCKNTCFAHNDVCELIYSAREDFQNLGLIDRASYSSVMVDCEWDIFKAYRAIHGIGYVDLTRHLSLDDKTDDTASTVQKFDTAFFPGCALAAYGENLTREIFLTMEELGDNVTMIDSCCGSSLKSAGFLERAEALCQRNADELEMSGAKELVCVCPGCANDMKKALAARGDDKTKVISLAKWLSDRGFKPKQTLPESEIYLSKSCQDRDGTYLDETEKVLGLDDQKHEIFHGCCGAGGAVSAFDPNRQARQSDKKLSFAPEGSTVVTMCPTCTYTYAYLILQNPRNITNKHYTELMFENQFDWNTTFSQLSSMWYGEYGSWLAQVFA